jgi:hypothetical protein
VLEPVLDGEPCGPEENVAVVAQRRLQEEDLDAMVDEFEDFLSALGLTEAELFSPPRPGPARPVARETTQEQAHDRGVPSDQGAT